MQASQKQKRYIKYLVDKNGLDFDEVDLYAIQKYGAAIDNWQFKKDAASELIDQLKSGVLNNETL